MSAHSPERKSPAPSARPSARPEAASAASCLDAGVSAEQLADAVQRILGRQTADPELRAEQLGAAYLAGEEAMRSHPRQAGRAAAKGQLEDFLLPFVRESLRGGRLDTPRSAALGLQVDPVARPIRADAPDNTDRAALELSARAFRRAVAIARTEENAILQRNLRWYQARLEHKSYAAIARAEGRVEATVRTGVGRARKFVLRVVHDLQNGRPAPLDEGGEPRLEQLRQLWFDQALERLAHELERTRDGLGAHPEWLNLAGLLAADRGRPAEARVAFERGLLLADHPAVRARILNNLGNLASDEERREEARAYWLRASRLRPQAPAPLVNLLAAASESQDYASAQHYAAELGELLSSGRLGDADRDYVCQRLADHPKLDWLRDTDAWRSGPARWIRSWRKTRASRPRPASSARSLPRVAAASALGALLGLLLPWLAEASPRGSAFAGVPGCTHAAAFARPLAPSPGLPGSRRLRPLDADGSGRTARASGGDSMGKPKPGKRAPEPLRLAGGDSMAIETGRRGRRGKRS